MQANNWLSPQYDLDTFGGRLRYYYSIVKTRNLFLTRDQLRDSRKASAALQCLPS